MTYAVEAYTKISTDKKDAVWQIIMLVDSKRRASKYAERHHLNGGVQLRVVEVSMPLSTQEETCPFKVEAVPGDKDPIRFKYREEAAAFAARFLNSVVSTQRPEKSE